MNRPITEELLILTKTYPSPSTTYRETTCVAAINNKGALRRLFPVPWASTQDQKVLDIIGFNQPFFR